MCLHIYNHLDINSTWKSLVASCILAYTKLRVTVCVCVVKAQTRVFNTSVSSAKLFISSTKHVRLHHRKCSSPAQNTFVTSNKPVRQQCDSYLQVSSKDHLGASDERVYLQCEIMFGGEYISSSLAINAFVFCLEVGLENPPKRTETRGKTFLKKLHFKLGLDL